MPLKINGSCLIIAMLSLKDFSVNCFILMPSKIISPPVGSKILVIKLNNVLLPWPDFPTMAIFLFGTISILKSFKMFSSPL